MSHAYNLQQTAASNPPIVIDTGASTSITPVSSDFIGDLQPANLKEVKQLQGNTKIVVKALVEWKIVDYWNVVKVIRTGAYYIPDASIRLFRPQSFFLENTGGHCVVSKRKITLVLSQNGTLEFPYDSTCNLPLMLLSKTRQSLIAGLRKVEVNIL